MNYIDKNIKEISNNNTKGILICKRGKNLLQNIAQMRGLLLENMSQCDIIVTIIFKGDTYYG